MYYPIGWQRILKIDLDEKTDAASAVTYPYRILSVQPNSDRELFLILTNKSIHIWFARPALEIVCHRRSATSIEEYGLNISAIWKFDLRSRTGTIVVSTSRDQLLFYQIRSRSPSSTSSTTFLLPKSMSNGDVNFKIKDTSSIRKDINISTHLALESVPALIVYLDGKLDFSDFGVSCLLAAGQRIIVASLKYGDIHGVLWDGSADKNFPWTLKDAQYRHNANSNSPVPDPLSELESLSISTPGNLKSGNPHERCNGYHSSNDANISSATSPYNHHHPKKSTTSPNSSCSASSGNSSIDEVYYQSGHRYCPYVTDIKYSSAHAGFSLVFSTGRAAFLPIVQVANQNPDLNGKCQSSTNERKSSRESSISEVGSLDSSQSDRDNHNIHPNINGLSSGKKYTHSTTVINYVPGIDNATCTEVNHKFRLIAYGLSNSHVIVCKIDELNRFAIINHRLVLSSSRFPDAAKKTGSITNLRYTPDNHALVTVWDKGGFAMWSVFGSLLFTSLSWEASFYGTMPYTRISSLCWGREGYNLWIVLGQHEDLSGETFGHTKTEGNASSNGDCSFNGGKGKLTTFAFAKAALINSPHITCVTESVLLLSEDRLYVGHSVSHDTKLDSWDMIQLPQSYISSNWPIRYAAIDRFGENIAIAGKYGFAAYSIVNSKWKLFGNETQERDLMICGDMIWWFDYIVIPCHNMNTNTYEIRAYSSKQRLDNNFAAITHTSKKMVLMSIFENRLLGLYSDGQMEMFLLNLRQVHHQSQNNNSKTGTARLTRSASFIKILQNTLSSEITTNNYTLEIVPFDSLVVSNLKAKRLTSITLTRLHFENSRTDDSILLNACGTLFLLERDPPCKLSTSTSGSHMTTLNPGPIVDSTKMANNNRLTQARVSATSKHFAAAALESTVSIEPCEVTFRAVSVLATNVEHYWISPDISNQHPQRAHYLTRSLWLLSGGQGEDRLNDMGPLKVWLPLLQNAEIPCPHLNSERIMLPVKCNQNIYPLSILFNDAIILGAENDTITHPTTNSCAPFCIINRQSQVYLHRILRELLKRNLECKNYHQCVLFRYAWEIAKSYDQLAYFAHSFELLLHEVLEEEASSAQKLDPLLPLIVKFIEEFPTVYLETVVHCTRKSELAMWPHLFSVVGNPGRLFERCLEENKLDTAASCLIILQSFERNIVSRQTVCELLSAAKSNSNFHYLLKELECFLERAQLTHDIVTENQRA